MAAGARLDLCVVWMGAEYRRIEAEKQASAMSDTTQIGPCVDDDGCREGDALCSECATALDNGAYQRGIHDVAIWLEKRSERWMEMAIVLGNKEAQRRQVAVSCETKQIALALRSGKWKEMARGC